MGQTRERIMMAAAGLTMAYLSFRAFSNGVRKEIQKRDKRCQVKGCKEKKKSCLEQHHIAPECMENGRITKTADPYSEPLLMHYEKLVDEIPSEERVSLRHSVKSIINSADNGITLCMIHHHRIHNEEDYQEGVRLEPNQDHPGRPEDLRRESLRNFISGEILERAEDEANKTNEVQ